MTSGCFFCIAGVSVLSQGVDVDQQPPARGHPVFLAAV
jgi:hypothetical protein